MSFRFNAKKVSLTYAQCGDLTAAELLAAAEGWGSLAHYVIGTEKHADGGRHLHAFFSYDKAVDTKSVRFFDVKGLHPNISKVKNVDAWKHYCCKDGDFIENCFFKTSTSFTKKRGDWAAWLSFQKAKHYEEVSWPIKMINGQRQALPAPTDKKVNWLIIGPADTGKTRWLNETFDRVDIWCVDDERYPFEGYEGQQVIVWDDTFPKRSVLIPATNAYKFMKSVGATRYRKYYWSYDQKNVCIILHNEPPTYLNDGWFQARFNVIYL